MVNSTLEFAGSNGPREEGANKPFKNQRQNKTKTCCTMVISNIISESRNISNKETNNHNYSRTYSWFTTKTPSPTT